MAITLSNNGKTMEKYHGIRANQDFPFNASQLGFTIQDRKLSTKKNAVTGLRENLIPFQFIGDEIPVITKSANYEESSIATRFEPLKSYSGSNSQDVSMRVIFIALGSKKLGHKTFWTIENIEELIRKLQSLVYPTYSTKFEAPKTVLLNMGSIFMDVPLKIKSISIANKSPFELSDITARTKEVSIEAVVSYPIYQSLEASDIMFSEIGNRVFAYKKFSQIKLK